jgi:FkbM family methyltransferase
VHHGLCSADVELRDDVADVHCSKVSGRVRPRVIEDLLQLLPRVKGVLIRLIGENLTATLHSLRFAYRIRFVDPVEPDLAIVGCCLDLGDCVVDVGANGGDWAAVLARAVGPSGSVLAFEADPYYAKVTRRALAFAGFRRVNVFDFGLSNVESVGHLRVVFADGLRASGLGELVDDETTNTVSVSLRTLDSVLGGLHPSPTPRLIKCDVEGHELQVLQGSSTALRGQPIVIAEVNSRGSEVDPSLGLDTFLTMHGYERYVVNEQRTGLVREATFTEREGFPNRWFLGRSDIERLRLLGILP